LLLAMPGAEKFSENRACSIAGPHKEFTLTIVPATAS